MFAIAGDTVSSGANEEALSKIQFYGVCVNSCPKFGDWVCDDEGEKLGEDKKQREVKLETCLDRTISKGGSFLFKDPGLLLYPDCRELFTHCWKIDSDTRPLFYRCLPLNNVSVTSTDDCLYPSKNLKVTDPGCSKKLTTRTTLTEAPAKKNYLYEQLNSVFATVMRYFGDIQRSYHVILLCGGLGAVVVGLVWLVMLRWAAGCMVWSSLIFVIVSAFLMTCFVFTKAGLLGATELEMVTGANSTGSAQFSSYVEIDDQNRDAWRWVAYICAVLFVVLLLAIVAMRSKIGIAIGIVKETSKAVHSMPLLLAYPLVTIFFLIILMVWWLIVAAYVISTDGLTLQSISDSGALDKYTSAFSYESKSNITTTNSSLSANSTAPSPSNLPEYNISSMNGTETGTTMCGDACKNMSIMRYIMLYHFFGLLWTNQVIQGSAILTIAGAFSKWYFAGPHDDDEVERDEDYDERLRRPVIKSCFRTARYHLGTVMFGGFIIAAVQFARAILEYIEANTKTWQEKNKVSLTHYLLLQNITPL